MRIYLDHAATTPCASEVVEAMEAYWRDDFGNASSLHREGEQARRAVEQARSRVADLIGAGSGEIVFTGSGTESDNMVVKGVAWALRDRGNHIITSVIEHHAVIESCKWLEAWGFEVTYLAVDEKGIIDISMLEQEIRKETVLVSIMHANNEVGTVQPIAEVGRICREKKVYFHSDAVQTAGSIPVDVNKLNVDLLSMSAHKLYGPKGVGALYVRKGVLLAPLLHGGGQEHGRRSATENVPGVVGFGMATQLAGAQVKQESARLRLLRDDLIKGIMAGISRVRLNGHQKSRLPGNVNISVECVEGEAMVLHLNEAGISCSTGSACSSASLKASHVLLAMGLPHELAHGSLRFSLGRATTKKDIDTVLQTLPGIVAKLRAMSPLNIKDKVYA